MCPLAMLCQSRAVMQPDGSLRIKDGKHTKFRCFSASEEVLYRNVYNLRKGNHDAIHAIDHDPELMRDALLAALPVDAMVVRIHVAGDFFNAKYFLAWCMVAEHNPDRLFYAYTKSLDYWIAHRDKVPSNLILTASRGGRHDHLIDEHGLRSSVVVFSVEEAESMGLEIDNDDSHASNPAIASQDFALLIHGTQPKGSDAAKALYALSN